MSAIANSRALITAATLAASLGAVALGGGAAVGQDLEGDDYSDHDPRRLPVDGSIQISDPEVLPLVRIPVEYPARAFARELEGLCRMRFDIDPEGAVIAGSIEADCTSTLFVRAATRAVAQWKFAPRVIRGEAVARRGATTSINFALPE